MSAPSAPPADPTQDGQKPPEGSAPAQPPAAAAAPAAAPQDPGSGSDGGNPYDLLAKVLESEEGQMAFAATVAVMNGGAAPAAVASAPAAAPQADAQATANRADLERKAEAGDGEAALEILRLNKAEASKTASMAEAEERVKFKALGDFVRNTPAIADLPQAEKMRIGGIMLEKGAEAGFSAILEAVKAGGGQANQNQNPTDAQQAERAKANEATAAANRNANTPDLPGASNPGGPPPIAMGSPPTQVLDNLFAWKDQGG